MRRPTIAHMDNGLPVQCLSERDFLFPDADEKYVPDVRAYIQSYDMPAFLALLRGRSRSKPSCKKQIHNHLDKTPGDGHPA